MVLFVIFDTETTTRSCPGVAVPGDGTYQKSMKNILHQSYLLKLLLSRIVFAIIWKFFRTTIKNAYVEWKICHIDFNTLWMIFF